MTPPKIGRCRECLSTLVLDGHTMVAALPYPNLPAAPLPTAPEPDDCSNCGNPLSHHRSVERMLMCCDSDGQPLPGQFYRAPPAPEIVTPGLDALLTEYAGTIWATVAEGYGCEVAAWPTHKVASATTDAEAWARTAIEAKFEQERFAARYNADAARQLNDTRVGLEVELATARSTLSQVEGERDDAAHWRDTYRKAIEQDEPRFTALEARVAALTGEKDEAVRVANHHGHVIQELQARVEGLRAENGRLTMELAAEIKGDGEFVEHAKRMVAAEKEKVAALAEVNETARQAIERHFLHSSPRKKAEALKAARAALGSHDGGARHE